MTLYEELDAMACAKSQTTLKFAKIFQEKFWDVIGSRHVFMPVEDALVSNSKLCSTLRMDFNTRDNLLFRRIEIEISITAVSKNSVIMEIDRKKFEITFDSEGVSDSFKAAMEHAATCFKERMSFTL